MNTSESISVTVKVTDSHIFRQYFLSKDIHVIGDITKPLFHMKSVAKFVGDRNQSRNLGQLDVDYYVKSDYPDGLGRMRSTVFLTEPGLYIYLFHLRTVKAKEFQRWVAKLLCDMRNQLVKDSELQAKILREKLAVTENYCLGMEIDNNEITDLGKQLFIGKYNDTAYNATCSEMVDFYIAKYLFDYHVENGDTPCKLYQVPDKVRKELLKLAEIDFGSSHHLNFIHKTYRTMDQYCISLGRLPIRAE